MWRGQRVHLEGKKRKLMHKEKTPLILLDYYLE